MVAIERRAHRIQVVVAEGAEEVVVVVMVGGHASPKRGAVFWRVMRGARACGVPRECTRGPEGGRRQRRRSGRKKRERWRGRKRGMGRAQAWAAGGGCEPPLP